MTDLWQPALCQTCRTRPAKKAGRKQCWWCTHPGVDPPPCKVCGIPKYFFNGFCEPCHPSRAHTARSCLHCFAWGVHHGRRCYACHVFTNRNPVGKCQSCRRELPLVTGYCRLGWHQARLRASYDDHGPAQQFLHLAGNGQQLFFAHMARPASPNIPPKKPRPAVAATRRLTQVLTERQLVLFDATRDLSRFQTHHRDSSNPQVIIGRQVAEALAEQRGWPKFTLESVDRGMVILFSQQPAGVPVPYSEVAQLTDRSISVERVCEVLAELSLLQDDRVDTLDAWFTDRTAPLSAMVRDEVRVWFEVLRGQRGRSRIRKPDTIRGYIHYALPHLVAWSQTYQSLREVTHDDVKGILARMTGHDRSHTLSSCRSLFGTLKKHRVIFRNPTARLSAGTGHRTVPLPLPDDELIAIATDAAGPERRLLFVLAAIQALRATQMRQLRRDDIDLGNRRLSVNGHVRPLDDATLEALSAYLRHRRDRWPLSTNPYLLVSQQTAYEDGPISSYWIKKRWRGMAASLERIRRDRQVDELLATGPDPLHFMAVFGSSATTATLYADAVADMLTTKVEQDSWPAARTSHSCANESSSSPAYADKPVGRTNDPSLRRAP